jgi:hypothetical protein
MFVVVSIDSEHERTNQRFLFEQGELLMSVNQTTQSHWS